jgi:EmrB/QacA subfamily drug resistance transporter
MSTNVDDQEVKLPRWTILSVTTLSSFMAALDVNIVTIALPAISKGLSSGLSLLGWVITAYILATAVLLLQSGRLGDRYGKKRVYLVGFAIFGAASAFCGLAPGVYELIAFRAVQGVGAAMLSGTVYPILFDAFPPAERGSAVGVNAIAWAVGSIAGPVLGGILVSLDWRLIFYINVPIATVAILLGLRRLPKKLDARGEGRSFNVVSSVLLAVAVGSLMLWLTFLDIRFLPLAIVAFAVFAVSELRSKNPLLNRELLKNRGFMLIVLGLAVLEVATQAIPFVMSFYFQSVSGMSPLLAGFGLAPFPVAVVVSSPIAGRLFDRFQRPARVSIVGMLVIAGFLAGLAFTITASTTSALTFLFLGLIGLGSGFCWAPSISAALKFSRPELRGLANGTALTVVYVTVAASIALAVSVSALSLPPSLAQQIYFGGAVHLTQGQAVLFKSALSNALVALSIVGFIGIPVFLLVSREQKKRF